MKRRQNFIVTSAFIPAGVWAFLDNSSTATTPPILTFGCYDDVAGSCTFDSTSGIPENFVDQDGSSYYSVAVFNSNKVIYYATLDY
jgi:hypothetical protein